MIETRTSYEDFLATKQLVIPNSGIEVDDSAINPMLYPFQRQLVEWALRKGRCALFADTGLGKTFMQLEWARLTGERVLIISPLAVASQTINEAKKLDIEVQYVRNQEQATGQIVITNYEMIDHFEPSEFGAVVLDESSILKSVDGKTKERLIDMFRSTPYRLCCTATPAPNDISEFSNHAEFLGAASREEMLAMFFVHDGSEWRLKGHAQEAFYKWMASWAMMVKMPSDIGFPDDGYVLPRLSVIPQFIEADDAAIAHEQGQLFVTSLKGITGRSAVRKATVDAKVEWAAETANTIKAQWIIWCQLNDEGRKLRDAIPDAVLVEGADSIEHKVDALTGFAEGRYRVLVSKASIAGFGMNFQNCHEQIFIGINDSYEQFYQAVRRSWRFGQKGNVNAWIVLSEIERPILENVQSKERMASEVSKRMVEYVSEYQREQLGLTQAEKRAYQERDIEGEDYRLMLGDCVERLGDLPSESVDFSVFSPPFLSLYVYSESERDMGNSKTEQDFLIHFDFMLAELERVLKPGRIVACHVAQVPATLVNDGYIGVRDFRGMVIQAFIRAGMIYHGDVAIDKDPQAQAIRTKSKSLLFVQLKKDSSWLRPGLADYILLFRKRGDNAVPIHPDIDNETWIEWARPIWYNIRESDTLHVAESRSEKDERHIAPLQLGTIERCIRLWSNPHETVLSPFMGIGSEGYESLLLDRKFIGIELKPEYFEVANRNIQRAIERKSQGRLM